MVPAGLICFTNPWSQRNSGWTSSRSRSKGQHLDSIGPVWSERELNIPKALTEEFWIEVNGQLVFGQFHLHQHYHHQQQLPGQRGVSEKTKHQGTESSVMRITCLCWPHIPGCRVQVTLGFLAPPAIPELFQKPKQVPPKHCLIHSLTHSCN